MREISAQDEISHVIGRDSFLARISHLKPGFHIVVSVVSVVSFVRKKITRLIQLYGNLPYNRSITQKRLIQLVVRDRMNSNDLLQQIQHEVGVMRQRFACNSYDKCNKNVSQNTPLLFSKWRRRSKVT